MSRSPIDSGSYRPHLDGLRALAVYLVVMFHAGIDQMSGGFIGVDIFFVLSGYLVTGVLVRDLEGPDQMITFGRFYSRRARRLLPAAAVNLIVTAAVFAVIAAPMEFEDARKGILAASLYFANWHFIAQSADYFAAAVELNPVQHYWSLSVEEQYYLIWPVLLAGLYVIARKTGSHWKRIVQLTIVSAVVASYALARSLAGEDINRAYYGTDTRAYELLAGALLAVTPGILTCMRRSAAFVAFPLLSLGLVATLILVGSAIVDVDPIWRGLIATLATCGLIVLLEASATGGICWVLSRPTLVYLGKISYGTYLWHWLIILVLLAETNLAPIPLGAIAALLSTAIASLSYQIIEHPIRTMPGLDSHRTAVLVSGLAFSLLVGLAVSPLILEKGANQFRVSHVPGTTIGGELPTPKETSAARADYYQLGSCQASGPVACPIVKSGSRTAIVVGESHALMLTPMLGEIAKRHDISLYAGFLASCPWPQGIRYQMVGPNCFRDQDDLYNRIIPELDPDIVFLAHRTVDDPLSSVKLIDRDLGALAGKRDRQPEALRKRISDLVRKLRASGRTVVMFEPIPVVAKEKNTLACLSKAKSIEECRFVTRVEPGPEEQVMRDLAATDNRVISVDLDPLVCPYLPICDPVVDGLIVKRDDNHLTLRFASSLVDSVEAYLVGKGAFK